MVPSSWLCGLQGSQKRNNGLCQDFCLAESCPYSSCPRVSTSTPPCMSLMTFELLPWCCNSEGVNLRRSMLRTFKRYCLGLHKPCLTEAQFLLVFTARSYEESSSWHWNPGGDLCSQDVCLDFYLPHMGVGPVLLHSCFSYHLDVAFSLYPYL